MNFISTYGKATLLLLLFSAYLNSFSQTQEEGKAIIDSLLRQLPKSNHDTVKASLLQEIGIQYFYLGDDRASNYIRQGLEFSRKARWIRGLGNGYNSYAYILLEKGDLAGAMIYADSSYNTFKSANRRRGMAVALQKKGAAYEKAGFYAEAIKNHLEEARLAEELKDTSVMVNACINIGNCHSSSKDDTKALEMYTRALELCKAAGLKRELIPILMNIGLVHADAQQYEKAADYYQQAELALQETVSRVHHGHFYLGKADLYRKTKDYNNAWKYMQLSLKTEQELNNKYSIGRNHFGIGLLLLELSNDSIDKKTLPAILKGSSAFLLQHSKQEFLQALAIAREVNDLEGIMEESHHLSTIEERLGNSNKALQHYKEYTKYKDSIFNDENKRKIAGLEMKHLEEGKNREISLINKDRALKTAALERKNLLLFALITGVIAIVLFASILLWLFSKKKKARFRQQVAEMENQVLRLQMNPHFIFNSLQTVNRYILDNEKEKASGYLSRFSHLIRLTLENSRKQEVFLRKDLQALEMYIQLESMRFAQGFRYTIDVAPEIDPDNTLVPPLLLQPFVENAIIHGIRDREDGEIRIRIFLEGKTLKCIITDNGHGFTANEDSPLPEAGQEHESLGLKITQERLQLLERLKKSPAFIHISGNANDSTQLPGVRVEMGLPYVPDC